MEVISICRCPLKQSMVLGFLMQGGRELQTEGGEDRERQTDRYRET